jgi:hypothetical protein
VTPVALVAGEHAEALSQLLKVAVATNDMVVIVPPHLGSQWFVDHPSPSDETSEIWFALSAPGRIDATRSQIKEAVRELNRVIESEKSMLRAKQSRMRADPAGNATALFDLTGHANNISNAETIRYTLRITSMHLERLHADLGRRLRS